MKTKIFLILICNLLICNLQFSQNITNTLGTSGVFRIKDDSSDYLTLNQSTGQINILKTLRLEYTSSSLTGVLFKGTERFLHNFQAGGTFGNNTFLGINAGNFTMFGTGFTASYNTGIGHSSLTSNTVGYYNTALGTYSLISNTTGFLNTGIGTSSLYSNNIGSGNTALGFSSLYNNTSGNYNTAVGSASLYTNISDYNTAVGNFSLFSNYSGNYNTAVGDSSMFSNYNGTYNTTLGHSSGTLVTSGFNLTCLGNNAEPTTGTAFNQITLGNNQITSLRCNVTTITSLSDMRDKKNIKDLTLGLDFITKLKPRLYNWDKREWYDDNVSDGSKTQETPTAGFIAQELDEVQTTENAEWLNLVLKDNPEKWEATPGNLFPVMVKAIQELKQENDELKEQLLKLSKIVTEIQEQNTQKNNLKVSNQ